MIVHIVPQKGRSEKRDFKKATVLILMIALLLAFTSCNKQETEKESEGSSTPGIKNNINSSVDDKNLDSNVNGGIIGDYQYPENPAKQLRSALEDDVNNRGLPMKIGGVEQVEFDSREYSQIKIDFTDGNENVCIITFLNKYLEYGCDELLDGRDNPSFTMAFKDPDNSQDMITALTSVIKYLSPDLSFEEAERLAAKQDETISTDGYAQPSDIGGYQVQAQYTNPHVFASTPDFAAKMGVKVRALKQIWKGTLDTGQLQELKTVKDHNLLTKEYPYWTETKEPVCVYAEFIVKNTWRQQSYLHGETWVVVDVESMTGQQYSLVLDTWEFPNAYEFGVGQQYTLYIQRYPRMGITYAVQQSESTQFNSRGDAQPIDYPTDDWEDHLWRVEPEGEGPVYDVCFILKSQWYGERFAASEGHGIGEKQWPRDPAWEDYTFIGWYDNLEWNGTPYTKDTPIYQDTCLYAKWKYTGSGGIWPRTGRGDIQGIDQGSNLSAGQRLTVTARGYNMNLELPDDQRFRWIPVALRLSGGGKGSFSKEYPYQADILIGSQGEQRLYITYSEEIFDGYDWQVTGQVREVEEVFLKIDS